jgi:hypothetical protein
MIVVLASMLVVTAARSSEQSQGDTAHPPTDPEARDLLKAICPEGIRTHHVGGGRLYVACRTCPRFTTHGGLYRAGSRNFFDLETVIYGSFTAPGAREAIGGFNGCEDHATTANFRSSVLLRKGPKGWRMIN